MCGRILGLVFGPPRYMCTGVMNYECVAINHVQIGSPRGVERAPTQYQVVEKSEDHIA